MQTHDMPSPTICSSSALIKEANTLATPADAGENSLLCVMHKVHQDAACYLTYQLEWEDFPAAATEMAYHEANLLATDAGASSLL